MSDARYPVTFGSSEHDGTLYAEDPDGSDGAWIVCENPAEVER